MLSATTLLALFATTAIASPTPKRATSSPLTVKFQTPSQVDDIDDLKVTSTVTNVGQEALTLVNAPNSLLSSWKTNTFSLTNGNGSAKAAGYKVKYDPLKVARTTLAPGESVNVEHELAGAYDFTTSGAGDYALDVLSPALTVVDGDALKSIQADVSKSTFALSGVGKLVSTEALAIAKTGENVIKALGLGLTKRVNYDSCDSTQKTGVDDGVTAGKKYASDAYSAIKADTSGEDRYTTWFGAYDEDRHSTATSHFEHISSQDWDSFTFDCGCDEAGTYAYVNPDTFGTIHLCPAYWDAPTTGTDSKGGTLVHESSHFTKNGGTQDHVYGQSDAKSLASSDPDQAIDNADNHEYYAEAGSS